MVRHCRALRDWLLVSVVRAFARVARSSSSLRFRRPSPPRPLTHNTQWHLTTVIWTRIYPRHLRNACGTLLPMKLLKIRNLKLSVSDSLVFRLANVMVSSARRVRYTRYSAIMADFFPVCVPTFCRQQQGVPPLHLPSIMSVTSSVHFLFHDTFVSFSMFPLRMSATLLLVFSEYCRCKPAILTHPPFVIPMITNLLSAIDNFNFFLLCKLHKSEKFLLVLPWSWNCFANFAYPYRVS